MLYGHERFKTRVLFISLNYDRKIKILLNCRKSNFGKIPKGAFALESLISVERTLILPIK